LTDGYVVTEKWW